jgi:hypothetical protein
MATTPREITVLLRLNPAPFIAAVTAVRQAAERFNALMASHPFPTPPSPRAVRLERRAHRRAIRNRYRRRSA